MLEAVLADAQRLGMLGSRPIPEVIRHAQGFVEALDDEAVRVIDLGSGGGVPGLVIAVARPRVHLTMVDRRQKRTDFLERAVARLGLGDRVQVWCRDVQDIARAVKAGDEGYQPWQVAVSRGFGPPERTVKLARALVVPGGHIVISEPPPDREDRWGAERLAALGVKRQVSSPAGVVVLTTSFTAQ
jgi:16S rRNA (guanine527-N7)-methyltransferase